VRHLALLASLSAVVTGCGGGASADPGEILSETAANLGKIRSGELTLEITAKAEGGETAGFELTGPFAVPEPGKLPRADMEYTQTAGRERGSVRFISTGENAYVETDEDVFQLPEEQVADLRAEAGENGATGLKELEIDDWMVDPEASEGDEIGGDETDEIRANLDIVAAINDLIQAAQDLGAGSAADLDTLQDANAEQVERAVESATIQVLSGKDDRLLRRLLIEADFGVDVSADVREALGSFAGAHVTFELTIANPNDPIDVEEPAGAEPFPG
jgi:hypothetical protein